MKPPIRKPKSMTAAKRREILYRLSQGERIENAARAEGVCAGHIMRMIRTKRSQIALAQLKEMNRMEQHLRAAQKPAEPEEREKCPVKENPSLEKIPPDAPPVPHAPSQPTTESHEDHLMRLMAQEAERCATRRQKEFES